MKETLYKISCDGTVGYVYSTSRPKVVEQYEGSRHDGYHIYFYDQYGNSILTAAGKSVMVSNGEEP